jgi:hypothetical protein
MSYLIARCQTEDATPSGQPAGRRRYGSMTPAVRFVRI